MIASALRRPSLSATAMASAYSVLNGTDAVAGSGSGTSSNDLQFTVTALSRWSVLAKQLPAAAKIKALHVYDFDNTLFKTPLPNPALWQGPTIGLLSTQDAFVNGGWWHDNRILAATGDGIDKEEPRAWEGWWNENVVELVKLTMKQPDALCVLLTGRSEHAFAPLIKRILASKGLDFDMVGLKPQVSPNNQRFKSTMHFKQIFLDSLMETYKNANEIRVYEDRPKHTKGFRDFFAEWNRRQQRQPTRGPLTAEVIQVADQSTLLDPVIEVAEIQHMINNHNANRPPKGKLRIKKTVFFTSYMIGSEYSQELIKLADIPSHLTEQDLIYHGNNILICPRPCPLSILDKVGGIGSKLKWEATGLGCYNDEVWAARMQPVPATAKFHSDNPVPLVVLALRRGAKPVDAGKINNWQPIPSGRSVVVETEVREKVILRIEPEDPREDEYESLFANKASKRKHAGDDDYAPRQQYGNYGGRNETRGYHTGGRGGRGGRGRDRGNRGGGRGSRGRGRGGGGYQGYRSLDDVDPKQGRYDDYNVGQQRQPGGNRGRPDRGPRDGQASGGQDLQNYY